MDEQKLLKISIVATVALAIFGVIVGMASGSLAIIFDGFYSLTDAFMTALALLVSRLITASATSNASGRFFDRFSVGFWHLEPMVLGLNGTLLMGAVAFAFITAVENILAGGRVIDFGPAVFFAVTTTTASCAIGMFLSRANETLSSGFVALDAKAWFMTAGLSLALLAAFITGIAIRDTTWNWLSPFVDPAILAVVCLVIFPTPIANVRQAITDILLVAPAELQSHVEEISMGIVKRYGFVSHRAYVARVGRAKQIELFFIAPPGTPARTLEEWDSIRDEIGILIGGEGPDRWLTIVFTSDHEWAD